MIRSTSNLIVNRAVTIQIILTGMMPMAIETEHQLRKPMAIVIEHTCHIVIKLLREWRSMHHNHRTVKIGAICLDLLLHKVKIWHRTRIVILDGIGIEAYKLDSARNKAEIRIAKNSFVRLITRT